MGKIQFQKKPEAAALATHRIGWLRWDDVGFGRCVKQKPDHSWLRDQDIGNRVLEVAYTFITSYKSIRNCLRRAHNTREWKITNICRARKGKHYIKSRENHGSDREEENQYKVLKENENNWDISRAVLSIY